MDVEIVTPRMTSPVSELLIQDSLCTDIFKTLSESVHGSKDATREILSSANYSDDVIGNLLDRMIQILPPEERNILGTEEKNIEDILQEANDLIRATTPLFSSSEDNSWNKTSKSSDTLNASDSLNIKDNTKIDSLSSEEKKESDSICSSLESVVVKDETTIPALIQSTTTKPSDYKEDKDRTISDCDSNLVYDSKQFSSKSVEMSNTQNKKSSMVNSNGNANLVNMIERTTQSNKSNSPSPKLNTAEPDKKYSSEFSSNERRVSELENLLQDVKQKHITEIQALKLSHSKEVSGLTQEINCLNDKMCQIQNSIKGEQSPDLKRQQLLQHLESEIKSQEQLIAGYEKENKKLCKEMLNLREVWKQRELQLVEEKQKLQNELQGMVLKSTSEAMEEELKDAQETIVKLQIELASYKSKNKELEVSCEMLRGELRRCHCERRDPPPSNTNSSTWHQLNTVIARKDIEIAQMNTTISILKGELSARDASVSPVFGQQANPSSLPFDLTMSQLQTNLAVERQRIKELIKEKELLIKENLDLKRQVRELESIVKRRQRTDSCFPMSESHAPNPRLTELERELAVRQETLTTLHAQFLDMQKKYEDHIQDLEKRLKGCREEIQTLKTDRKKEEGKTNIKKLKPVPVVKEETHLLATIRGLRQEAAAKEKEISKLHKEIEEVRLTNRRLQKEREKQLNSIPTKISSLREKYTLKKTCKTDGVVESNSNLTSPNNNINPIMFSELQESNMVLKSKTKTQQEEIKRLEQDLIAMHNKRVHDLNMLQHEHELEVSRLLKQRESSPSQASSELQGQLYTQQMVINHLKNKLKQMEELKSEVTLLRAERDHLEKSLAAVNSKMCFLQNAQSPESVQYKTLLAKLETLEKNQEIREQKLNTVRELLCRSTQGQGAGLCSGSCRDKLLDKNRQICYYRAQMDRILEAILEIRRTK